jgi:tRNA pseudouridine55 synthase
MPFLVDAPKAYQAEVELGIATDTYDAEGKVTNRLDPSSITREQVEAALLSFLGSTLQTPPMYSAIKHQGRRLYDLARAGIEVERKKRRVQIFRLELLEWLPPHFIIEIECGKGTYVRSLVHDLGQSLGCGSYLRNLLRLRSGLFDISDSLTVPQLEYSFLHGHWRDLLYPMDVVLEQWAAAVIGREKEHQIRNGRPVALGEHRSTDKALSRAYSVDGCFLAVLRFCAESGLWQPEKVFSATNRGLKSAPQP